MREFERVILNWDTNVESFLKFVSIFGVKEDSITYEFIKGMVQTAKDIDEWSQYFDGDPDNVLDACEEYLLQKNF